MLKIRVAENLLLLVKMEKSKAKTLLNREMTHAYLKIQNTKFLKTDNSRTDPKYI
jgi:hypothetical protein